MNTSQSDNLKNSGVVKEQEEYIAVLLDMQDQAIRGLRSYMQKDGLEKARKRIAQN